MRPHRGEAVVKTFGCGTTRIFTSWAHVARLGASLCRAAASRYDAHSTSLPGLVHGPGAFRPSGRYSGPLPALEA
jgi:hypothetical protein